MCFMFVWMRCEIECLRKRIKTVNATIIQCPLCNRSHWFACVSESKLSDIKHKVHVYSAGQQKQNWWEWRNVSMLIQEVPGHRCAIPAWINQYRYLILKNHVSIPISISIFHISKIDTNFNINTPDLENQYKYQYQYLSFENSITIPIPILKIL